MITREVVSKYYLWKRTPEFREWRLRQTVKKTKKKKKEAELLRQWGDESDEDSETKAFWATTTSAVSCVRQEEVALLRWLCSCLPLQLRPAADH